MSAYILWDVVFLSAHPVMGLGTVAILVGHKIHLRGPIYPDNDTWKWKSTHNGKVNLLAD